jgi:hypothetical protein
MRSTWFIVLGLACLPACGGSGANSPSASLQAFFTAALAEDNDSLRALQIAAELDDNRCRFDKQQLEGGYAIGSTETDGDRACVLVDEKTVRAPMRYVLRREGGSWRVSMRETMLASFSVDPTQGKDMQQVLKNFGVTVQKQAATAAKKAPKPAAPTPPK